MSQLDMFGDDDVAKLITSDSPATFTIRTPWKVDTIARFLAGFGFPGHVKYENLPLGKRNVAKAAAEAALAIFDDYHHKEV